MVTGKRKEKISAFLDNDMHRDELMSFSLSSEQDDAKIAQRYQMLGDALRDEMSDSSFVDVSAAVHDAIADLPEYNQAASVEQTSSQSVSQSAAKPAVFDVASWDIASWFRPVAGMAMAVTVAVVMVMTVTEQDDAGIASVAITADTQPASVQLAVDTGPAGMVPSEAAPLGAAAPVNQHLVNQHLEFATQDTLQGRLPYVRAVSFEPNNNSGNHSASHPGNLPGSNVSEDNAANATGTE